MSNFKRTAGYSEHSLLQNSSDHLYSAESLFRRGPRCFDSAGYLAHLGIELLLKTCILHKTDSFPQEHDLNKLRVCLQKTGSSFELAPTEEKTFSQIRSFGNLRYPRPSAPVEIGSEDWTSIQALVFSLIRQFPKPLGTGLKKLKQMYKDGPIEKGGRMLVQG